MARCAGTSGVVASYRRDPLVELHQEGRACYNFLYCIKPIRAYGIEVGGGANSDQTGRKWGRFR
jgi:hypothetical protein